MFQLSIGRVSYRSNWRLFGETLIRGATIRHCYISIVNFNRTAVEQLHFNRKDTSGRYLYGKEKSQFQKIFKNRV